MLRPRQHVAVVRRADLRPDRHPADSAGLLAYPGNDISHGIELLANSFAQAGAYGLLLFAGPQSQAAGLLITVRDRFNSGAAQGTWGLQIIRWIILADRWPDCGQLAAQW